MASRKRKRTTTERSGFFGLLKRIGPGFITGAADDDPSGIATYSQTGARFGYGHLWTPIFTFPLMTAVQEMCGRIGMVTGRGIAGILRARFPSTTVTLLVALLFLANAVNIGADLGAMADAGELVFGVHGTVWLVSITAVTLALIVFVPYGTYVKYLKLLTLTLLAYVAAAFAVRQDWTLVALSVLLPHVSLTSEYFMNVVAILGTTISPYLFFWQADEEVEEEVLDRRIEGIGEGTPRVTGAMLKRMRTDTVSGMLLSNVIMFFIILTAASTLHAHGVTDIETAADAAEALRPLAGDVTFLVFALGILGTGLLAIPVLAGSAAYAVAEIRGWKSGLSRTASEAKGFYAVIALIVAVGFLVNFLGIPPFKMLYYTAVLNGIAAPPLLFVILRIGNDRRIMGRHVNGRVSNALGWTAFGIMTLACLAFFVTMAIS
ncbi:divalent metal cation transporter [Candidatus Uhrbacteria bacterium]|nr:divalent metal cation transporter [Candidatus Uhrbacteria bacterium]